MTALFILHDALTGIVVFIAFCLVIASCNDVQEVRFKFANPSTLQRPGPKAPSPTWGVRRK